MFLAGIDEAGYGPLLGPLVIGCCAIEVPSAPEPPDLWQRLSAVISRKADRAGRKLHINDSKAVYSPTRGLRELERAVLVLAAACHGRAATLDELIVQLDPHAPVLLAQQRWYGAGPGEKFPLEVSATTIGPTCNALATEMQRSGIRLAALAAKIAPERYLNRMFAATHNKSSVLFSLTAIHIQMLLDAFGGRGLTIVCDRQGGRERYGRLLRLMFPDWPLTIVQEETALAHYELGPPGRVVTLIFREKAEGQWLPTAVASLVAKYLREALMARWNAFWAAHVPGVAPTAGYYTDGVRFLEQTAAVRRSLGVTEEELVRSR